MRQIISIFVYYNRSETHTSVPLKPDPKYDPYWHHESLAEGADPSMYTTITLITNDQNKLKVQSELFLINDNLDSNELSHEQLRLMENLTQFEHSLLVASDKKKRVGSQRLAPNSGNTTSWAPFDCNG